MMVRTACGTGLETTILVANKIALGQIDSGIACGADTTSDAPIALNEPGCAATSELDPEHVCYASFEDALALARIIEGASA